MRCEGGKDTHLYPSPKQLGNIDELLMEGRLQKQVSKQHIDVKRETKYLPSTHHNNPRVKMNTTILFHVVHLKL